MNSSGRLVWLVFAAVALAVAGVCVFLAVSLRRAERDVRFEADQRQALRRIETVVLRVVSREADRPYTHWESNPFLEAPAYTKLLQKIAPEQIKVASPLLSAIPDFVRLHFQINGKGELASPQIPTGNFLDSTQEAIGTAELERRRTLLTQLGGLAGQLPSTTHDSSDRERAGNLRGARRKSNRWIAAPLRIRAAVTVRPFEPHWVAGELLYVRTIDVRDEGNAMRVRQGFWIDWPALRAVLGEEISDLFPAAKLVAGSTTDEAEQQPTAIPILLQAQAARGGWSARDTAVTILIGFVLAALLATALALHRSRQQITRERRFASLVTHELRGPLTSFRLYSDLLAEGLVTDEAKQKEYHEALQSQARHMAKLVENVVAYARLETGRAHLGITSLTLGELTAAAAPDLERVVASTNQTLHTDLGPHTDLRVRAAAPVVTQILVNLVENACKYGEGAIELTAARNGSHAELVVRDHGPGIAPERARAMFTAFDRGGRDEADQVRGLGLGLSLARGLARELGGDVAYDPPADGGARFLVRLRVN